MFYFSLSLAPALFLSISASVSVAVSSIGSHRLTELIDGVYLLIESSHHVVARYRTGVIRVG